MVSKNERLILQKIKDVIFNGNKTAIFGTGAVGEMIYNSIKYLELPFCFFIVNDGFCKNREFLGEKVYEISELQSLDSSINIIYAIQDRSEKVAHSIREKYGSQLLFEDYRIVLYILLEKYYVSYFTKKNIDISGQIIDFGNCKIINPFLQEFNFKLEWLTAIGDIILPSILSDYSCVNEGSYEIGHVFLEKGDIVFDCGANVGAFSAVAASKGCKVYAFEPIPDVTEQLSKTAELYEGQIEIVECALGDRIGESVFYVDTEYSAVCTMQKELSSNRQNTQHVNLDTIDNIVQEKCIEKVDFIKADIEGAERFMLKGAEKTLRDFQPKLAIAAYHLSDDIILLENIIKDINPKYQIIHKWKTLYAYVP